MRLRHAVRTDLDTVVDVWVDAFETDPFQRWIQPDDTRWPAFGRAWLAFIADLVFERGHTYLADPADLAIAWIPPDLALVGPEDLERGHGIIAAHASEAKADDTLATILSARAHIPETSHWTLQYIGVRSAQRGTGLGVAAVAPRLRVCDAEAMPCELISTNPRNISFYERLGFRVTAEVPTPDGATTLRPMHREPVIP